MTVSRADETGRHRPPNHWSESWDRLMATYQPGRDRAIERLIELVETRYGPAPRVLDIGGGTGTLGARLLARLPRAEVALVDLDPVMLAIADGCLPPTVRRVRADFRDPHWISRLPRTGYDAVLAVMALHYLPPGRLTALYAELSGLLRPGGFLANVDDMPDAGRPAGNDGTPGEDATSWARWWEEVAADPVLGPAAKERARLFGDSSSAEWNPPAEWHLQALRRGNFTHAEVTWRDGRQAAVLAVRSR